MIVLLGILAAGWLVLCSWLAELLWGRAPFTGGDGPAGHRTPGADVYSRRGG